MTYQIRMFGLMKGRKSEVVITGPDLHEVTRQAGEYKRGLAGVAEVNFDRSTMTRDGWLVAGTVKLLEDTQ